ncbi:precorrin-2 C(20)-methyltransferase [Clostridium sp. D33t1_170424_F3]|uniref:precorrin-2 C(20)-methyltransferase n=1 Tax=Clostridium sp. D33t1_170424_F3 TaxID=2787099 RepID=UPI0018AA4683|nr:precorrin-2 C(20)-methyltransferase [Clostridium sp. D33t1_170424_F3]
MAGILYCVGVGPGDPELLTRKAARLIQSCPVAAAPGGTKSVAYQIALQAVPELSQKSCLDLHLPMTKDQTLLQESHDRAANQILAVLERKQDVALLTLGDPSIYSTCMYLQERVQNAGCSVQIVPGVPSFCAAAAALGVSLTEADQPLRILPASYPCTESELEGPGTKILMKSGRKFAQIKQVLRDKGLGDRTMMVQNCGMEDERIYSSLADAEEQAGYFTLLIVK